METRTYYYARVSSKEQNLDRQISAFKELGATDDNYSYPLFELGWHIDAQIHPMLYTIKDWAARNFSPLYKNVEQDGIVLC